MDLFGTPDEPETDDRDDEAMESPAPMPAAGLLPPRATPELFGHENAERRLLDAFQSGRPPQSLIFSGQQGIGKSVAAFRLARYLLKNPPADPAQDSLFGGPAAQPPSTLHVAPDDPVFRKVSSGGHPDLLTVERQMDQKKGRLRDVVDVEEVRKVAPFLRMTASGGGWRVVVIDDADTMNRSSQNAVLKILEEPPSNALLILVTHRMGAMIPTIRSRCQLVTFHPLEDSLIRELARREFSDAPAGDLDLAARMSGGSLGQALRILESGGPAMLQTLIGLLTEGPQAGALPVHALADTLSRPGQEESYETFRNCMIWLLSNAVSAKAKGRAGISDAIPGAALKRFPGQTSLAGAAKICENIQRHFERAEQASLGKRQAILGAFSIFETGLQGT